MSVPSYGSIIEHGNWSRYDPATLPEGAPEGALYVRRDGDGIDWYVYVKDTSHFRTDTAKLVVTNNSVSTANTEQARLFPQNALVLELTDTPLDDLHERWSRCVYDPATQTFSDPPPITAEVPGVKSLEARVAALEAKLGGA